MSTPTPPSLAPSPSLAFDPLQVVASMRALGFREEAVEAVAEGLLGLPTVDMRQVAQLLKGAGVRSTEVLSLQAQLLRASSTGAGVSPRTLMGSRGGGGGGAGWYRHSLCFLAVGCGVLSICGSSSICSSSNNNSNSSGSSNSTSNSSNNISSSNGSNYISSTDITCGCSCACTRAGGGGTSAMVRGLR